MKCFSCDSTEIVMLDYRLMSTNAFGYIAEIVLRCDDCLCEHRLQLRRPQIKELHKEIERIIDGKKEI